MADLTISVLQVLSLVAYSLLIALPVCTLAWLAGKLHARISKKFKLSWLFSSLAATYVFVLIGVVVLYSIPLLSVGAVQDTLPPEINSQFVFQNGQTSEVPLSPENNAADALTQFAYNAARLLLVSLVLSLLLLPLELLASFAFDHFQKRKKQFLFGLYAASFSAILLAFLVLIVFPWLQVGLLYYIFFG